jgi:hypothetical protein
MILMEELRTRARSRNGFLRNIKSQDKIHTQFYRPEKDDIFDGVGEVNPLLIRMMDNFK